MDAGTKKDIFSNESIEDLKGRAIRGGFIAVAAQAIKFFFRTGALILLARILVPKDFGLIGMVTAITGILDLVKDAGLSTITIQRHTITEEQISTLFWINLTIGIILTIVTITLSPILAIFYQEPRLVWVAVALATGFLFNGASAQHLAILQRRMRYSFLSMVDIISLIVSIVIGVSMAITGFGYWSLVGMALTIPVTSAVFVFFGTKWVPKLPSRNVGIRSMLNFGGNVTLNSIVIYLAYNTDKILLGRVWGAEALGIYGRAYQLINLPTAQLNSAIGWVALPALSRLQNDPDRFGKYFLKGYSLLLAMTIPATILCAVYAEEIIGVILGPKWKDTVPIFRLLSPTVLAFALINPFGWLLIATGQVKRSLRIAFLIAPLVIGSYVVGLRYGPEGVAVCFSMAMTLLIIPVITWARKDLPVSSSDIVSAVARPLVAGVIAAALSLTVKFYSGSYSSIFKLASGSAVLFFSYVFILLFVMGQKNMYMDIIRELKKRSSTA